VAAVDLDPAAGLLVVNQRELLPVEDRGDIDDLEQGPGDGFPLRVEIAGLLPVPVRVCLFSCLL
jgi:hypothetical protein